MRKNTVQTKQWLDKCYMESSPLRKMVEKRVGKFKRSRTSINDAERSGTALPTVETKSQELFIRRLNKKSGDL